MKDACPTCNRDYTVRYKPCAHGRDPAAPCVHGDLGGDNGACPNVIKVAVERKQQRTTCSEECYQKLRYDKQIADKAKATQDRGDVVTTANHR